MNIPRIQENILRAMLCWLRVLCVISGDTQGYYVLGCMWSWWGQHKYYFSIVLYIFLYAMNKFIHVPSYFCYQYLSHI